MDYREKAKRIDEVDNSLTKEELLRLLPEITSIVDDDIRRGTINAFLVGCPDYFWTNPSSSSGKYHSHDEIGIAGNYLHTKRVFTEYEILARTFLEMQLIDEYEYDCGKSAVFIHDMLKYGYPSERNEHTINDHDVCAAEFVRVKTDLPDEVADAIDAHNGGWYDGKTPEKWLEFLVHFADMVAASPRNYVSVYDPPAEITDNWEVYSHDEI